MIHYGYTTDYKDMYDMHVVRDIMKSCMLVVTVRHFLYILSMTS